MNDLATTYADNIRTIYQQSTDTDRKTGQAWYHRANEIVARISVESGISADRVAAALAALSPNNPWNWNVQDAAAFALAAANGDPMPTATTYGINQRRAWDFLTGETDWTTAAPKVRSFVRNILGDHDTVTVDIWALRVASMGTEPKVRTPAHYRTIANAYRLVAGELNIAPRDLQAITWVIGRRTALGLAKPVRPSTSLKRGTFTWVATLLTAGT